MEGADIPSEFISLRQKQTDGKRLKTGSGSEVMLGGQEVATGLSPHWPGWTLSHICGIYFRFSLASKKTRPYKETWQVIGLSALSSQ